MRAAGTGIDEQQPSPQNPTVNQPCRRLKQPLQLELPLLPSVPRAACTRQAPCLGDINWIRQLVSLKV